MIYGFLFYNYHAVNLFFIPYIFFFFVFITEGFLQDAVYIYVVFKMTTEVRHVVLYFWRNISTIIYSEDNSSGHKKKKEIDKTFITIKGPDFPHSPFLSFLIFIV